MYIKRSILDVIEDLMEGKNISIEDEKKLQPFEVSPEIVQKYASEFMPDQSVLSKEVGYHHIFELQCDKTPIEERLSYL